MGKDDPDATVRAGSGYIFGQEWEYTESPLKTPFSRQRRRGFQRRRPGIPKTVPFRIARFWGLGYSRLMREDEAGTLAQLKTLRKEVFDRRQLGTSCSARVHHFGLSKFVLHTVKTDSSNSAPILR